MGESSEPQRKRSRFDQTEPEPRRHSRFDRRSRSPARNSEERRRSRSPISRKDDTPDSGAKSPGDAQAAAAAAAAKINAAIQAKKGIQHVEVPPIRSVASPPAAGTPTSDKPAGSSASAGNIGGDIYIADGDYIKDIEINDLRNRYTLTRGATQKTIKDETGADVTTRGSYLPDKAMATPTNPPLYLHITSTSKEGLEKAVERIEEMMRQDLPNLVDERRFRRRETEQVERDELGRRKWPEERIPIEIEPLPGFNLRAQVVGQGGAYVKHIQSETRCRVQIKGRGSGFYERDTNQESDEPMFLHVTGPDPKEVQNAKELCEDLLGNVKQQWQQFKDNPPQRNYDRGGNGGYNNRDQHGTAYGSYGGGGGGGDRGRDGGGYGERGGRGYGHSDHHNSNSYGGNNSYSSQGYGGGGYGGGGGAQSPPGASNGSSAASGQQDQYAAWQQWAQQNPEQAQQYYQQYYAAYYQSMNQSPSAGGAQAPGASGQPPPPPGAAPGTGGGGGAGGSGSGGYNAVPPPPGM